MQIRQALCPSQNRSFGNIFRSPDHHPPAALRRFQQAFRSGSLHQQPSVCRLVRCSDDPYPAGCRSASSLPPSLLRLTSTASVSRRWLRSMATTSSPCCCPSSNAIGLHFYSIWEAASLDERCTTAVLTSCCLPLPDRHLLHMGREWNSPTASACAPICVAYSAPVAAVSHLVWPFGQVPSLTLPWHLCTFNFMLVFQLSTTS